MYDRWLYDASISCLSQHDANIKLQSQPRCWWRSRGCLIFINHHNRHAPLAFAVLTTSGGQYNHNLKVWKKRKKKKYSLQYFDVGLYTFVQWFVENLVWFYKSHSVKCKNRLAVSPCLVQYPWIFECYLDINTNITHQQMTNSHPWNLNIYETVTRRSDLQISVPHLDKVSLQ